MVYSRSQYEVGDVRVKFEFVQQPHVMVLAQQVQTSDEVFRLRPWNPFSPWHNVVLDEDSEPVHARKENEYKPSLCMFYCDFADLFLENLCDDSIEVIENCFNKNVREDHFLIEARNDMAYAKWFRPILGLCLTIILLIILSKLEELHLISYFKNLYQS